MAVYVVAESSKVACKIGFTDGTDANKRIQNLQTSHPFKLELICVGKQLTKNDEQEFHGFLQDCRTNGGSEWFYFDHAKTKRVVEFIQQTNNPLPDSWLWNKEQNDYYETVLYICGNGKRPDNTNRVTEAIRNKKKLLSSHLSAGLVTQKRLDEINQTLNFNWDDYVRLRNLKSKAMSGRITNEEAMTLDTFLDEDDAASIQRQILQLWDKNPDITTKQIASKLGLSKKTVEMHFQAAVDAGWIYKMRWGYCPNRSVDPNWRWSLTQGGHDKLNSQPLEVKIVLTAILAELLDRNLIRFLHDRLATQTLDFNSFIQGKQLERT